MQLALVEAQKAYAMGEVPVGCVIVANGQVVGRGHNLTETLADVTAHAEVQAITAAAGSLGGKYLTQCSLYVTVEPCVMCAGAIGWSQLSTIVYGASDIKRGFQEYAPKVISDENEIAKMNHLWSCSNQVSIVPQNRGIIMKMIMPWLKENHCDMKISQSVLKKEFEKNQ